MISFSSKNVTQGNACEARRGMRQGERARSDHDRHGEFAGWLTTTWVTPGGIALATQPLDRILQARATLPRRPESQAAALRKASSDVLDRMIGACPSALGQLPRNRTSAQIRCSAERAGQCGVDLTDRAKNGRYVR